MVEDHAEAKATLRGALRAVSPPADVATAASAAACARALAAEVFGRARRVVVYAALPAEVDVSALAAAGRSAGKRIYYPRVVRDDLEFLACEPAALRPGAFGAFEPGDGEPLRPSSEPTLFVVPGMAFDLCGRRLGRGRGFYDRGLARYRDARRLGIAFEYQIVPRLPDAPWDVGMSVVVTESRLIGAPGTHP